MVVVVAVVAAAAGFWLYNTVYSSYQGPERRIYIADGDEVVTQLTDSLGSWGQDVVATWKLLRGRPGRAVGSYILKPGEKAIEMARRLRSGAQDPILVAVPQARTIADVNRALAARLMVDAAELDMVADSIFTERGFTPETFACAIVPDSYEMYWTAPATKVINSLVDARDAFWNGDRVARAQAAGLTPEEVVTLASIVEEETAQTDEYPVVARLYINRLERGMKLQADPTVKYAVGDPTLRRILNRHLEVDSKYNTYKYEGLPPGPIRVAGRRSIDAVLNAPAHNYLYMCAREDFSGRHNFTASYNEHLANARRYQAALNRLNIK